MDPHLSPDRVPLVSGTVTEIWTAEAADLGGLSALARGAIRVLAELYRPSVLPIQLERFGRGVALGSVEARSVSTDDLDDALAQLAGFVQGDRAISLYGPTVGGRLRVALPDGVSSGTIDVALDGRTQRAVPLLPAPDLDGATTAWMSLADAGARYAIAIADGEARLELSLDPAWFSSVDPPTELTILGAPWSAWQRRGQALLAFIEAGLTAGGWRLLRRR